MCCCYIMHCFLQKENWLLLCVFKLHSFTFFLHGYYHGYSIDNGTVSFENYFIYSVYSFNAEKLISFFSIGRLRERTKRDESDSGDGSGNVSDAGLDLTGSGHSSRRSSPRPLTRTPDRVRSGTKTPSRMPNRVRSGTKTPSKHPHKYWGGLDFRGLFIF